MVNDTQPLPATSGALMRQAMARGELFEPKEVHLVAEIPRVGLDKVRRHLLAAELGLE